MKVQCFPFAFLRDCNALSQCTLDVFIRYSLAIASRRLVTFLLVVMLLFLVFLAVLMLMFLLRLLVAVNARPLPFLRLGTQASRSLLLLSIVLQIEFWSVKFGQLLGFFDRGWAGGGRG